MTPSTLCSCILTPELETRAIRFLLSSGELDIFFDEGCFFKLAISEKNPRILKALLERFERIYPQGFDQNLPQRHKLQAILARIVDDVEEEDLDGLKDIITPYVDLGLSDFQPTSQVCVLEDRGKDVMLFYRTIREELASVNSVLLKHGGDASKLVLTEQVSELEIKKSLEALKGIVIEGDSIELQALALGIERLEDDVERFSHDYKLFLAGDATGL